MGGGVGTQAGTVNAEEAKIAPKYEFIRGMIEYNKAHPRLYRQIAGFTYSEVMFLNLSSTQNSLAFDAYVSSPSDVSRLLLGLSRSPQLQGLPTITGVPGWNEEEQRKP